MHYHHHRGFSWFIWNLIKLTFLAMAWLIVLPFWLGMKVYRHFR